MSRRSIALLASATMLFSIMFGAARQATASSGGGSEGYYPVGPQRDVPLSTLEDNGWIRCFSEPYNTDGTSIASIRGECTGTYLIVTGRPVGSSTLSLLAAAPSAEVFAETARNAPHLVNGTYWYFTSYWSMGFSDVELINQDSCDIGADKDYSYSLCWHMDGSDTESLLFGGYLLGNICRYCDVQVDLGDAEGASYLREIYTTNSVPGCALAATVCPTITSSGATRVLGAPGTGYTTAYATYTWYRCGQEGEAVKSAKPPVTCRMISSFKGSAAQMALRPYTITRQDVRAGYLRLAVKVLNTTYYSAAYSTAP